MMNASSERDTIEVLAMELWKARGRRDGFSDEDWFEAARQLRDRSGDAPPDAAVHTVNTPPADASGPI
jgi:hypothetical protein